MCLRRRCGGLGILHADEPDLARQIQPQNVEVRYVSTMLGYVGRTGGNPMTVTVTVKCLTFNLFFPDAWYRWSNQPTNCPSGTPLGAQVAAASSYLSEGLSKPASQP